MDVMSDFDNLGREGYYKHNDSVVTFQIGNELTGDSYSKQSEQLNTMPTIPVGKYAGYNVLLKGSNNNLPNEQAYLINKNRLLPRLLEKQVYLLYGKGIHIYKSVIDKGKIVREWQANSPIMAWLDNWQERGVSNSVEDFAINTIRDFYWYEDMWATWRMNNSRRIGGAIPVAGLEHIDNKSARLSTANNDTRITYYPKDTDFNKVMTGRWDYGYTKDFEVFNRFRPDTALKNGTSISYHKAGSPGQVYGMNKFYEGIRPWLIGTNNNPDSINAFLENSLSATHHVIIPAEYVTMIERKLQDFCEENQKREDAGKTLLKPNGIDIGTQYHVGLRDQYLKCELNNLTSVLSGRKNEGKVFASFSFKTQDGESSWKIEPIDQKYKEFIQALLEYDKRADSVITAALGIDSSISNISKDGIISKSGADVYYNYIIYLLGLSIPEQKCTEAINWAIKLNFPQLYSEGFRAGFYQETPSRQEEVSPNDRLQNTVNATTENSDQIAQLLKEVENLKKHTSYGH